MGVQNPETMNGSEEEATLKQVQLEEQSIDTSGDFERYAMIGDLQVHHIIDIDTMMPGDDHRSVTVTAEDAGVTEYLSTELFLLPYEEGYELIESMENVEALWITNENTVKMTEGMEEQTQ